MTQARFAKALQFVALICLSSVCSSTTGAEGKSAPDVLVFRQTAAALRPAARCDLMSALRNCVCRKRVEGGH